MNRIIALTKEHILSIGLVFLILGCQESTLEEQKIVIATAANMQFAMEALSTKFTEDTGVRCDLVVSSTGKLTAQIKEGAPFDILVAADMKYPEEIFNSGFAVAPPKIYALGKLVLWTTVADLEPSIELLKSSTIKHIAIANPETAPYGQAAIDFLKSEKLYEPLKSKLVFGESIAQTNQFINTRSAELGFTAMSVVKSPKLKNIGRWIELNTETYSPINQGIILIDRTNGRQKLAQSFYNFLFSETGRQILNVYGYEVQFDIPKLINE